jgi:hypothetical protein
MSVILLLLGLLAIGAGLTAIGFGIPVNGSDLGYTLVVAGATGLSSGLILLGLAAAVHQLKLIAEGLRARVQSSPGRSTEPELASEVLPDRSVPARSGRAPEPRLRGAPLDVSSAAIERLRSTLPRPDRVVPEAEGVPLSPNGDSNHRGSEMAPEPTAVSTPARSSSGEVEMPREPRLDFLFRSRSTRAGTRESFEKVWPKQSARQQDDQIESQPAPSTQADTRRDPELPPIQEDRAATERAAPSITDDAPSAAILKSGVVDGMAYTLYADGSIEAQLPQGTVRFGSITELRAHIESNS